MSRNIKCIKRVISISKYCHNCGAELFDEDKFCSSCGSSTKDYNNDLEKVWQVLFTNLRLGFFKSSQITLIITDTRIAFIEYNQELMNQILTELRQSSQGRNIISRSISLLQSGPLYIQRYYEKSIEDSLSENPDNFYLPHNNVESIVIIRSRLNNDTGKDSPTKIQINAMGGKYTLILSDTRNEKALINNLRTFYGKRLRVG